MTASSMARSRALTSREGLVGEVMGLKIAPDRLDFIEAGGVFRQPIDGEPVCAGGQGGERAFAGVDRTIVLDQHDRLGLSPGLRHRLTVSSRRPSASAILELVQPASEKNGGAGSALCDSREIGKSQQAGALFIARRNRRLSRDAIRRRQRTAKNLSVG
jgi:hypothetical protein